MTRLHLGNGTIYLKNFINIDLPLEHHYLSFVRPDLVEKNITTIDKYYKEDVTQETIENKSRQFKEVVCDMFSDIKELPFLESSVDEILLVQVFEHFSYLQGDGLLQSWYKLLKKGGKLTIDIPDLDGTIDLYTKAKTQEEKAWAVRLLMGSQKNEYGLHKGMYNKKMIQQKLENNGYRNIQFGENIHFYPAFSVTAYK